MTICLETEIIRFGYPFQEGIFFFGEKGSSTIHSNSQHRRLTVFWCEKLWKEWRLIGTEFDDKIDHCRLHLVEAERRMNSFQPRTKRFDDDIQVIHWSSITFTFSVRSSLHNIPSPHTIQTLKTSHHVLLCQQRDLDLITGVPGHPPSTVLCVREFQNCQKHFFLISFQ